MAVTFSDDFNRADALLSASVDWTAGIAGNNLMPGTDLPELFPPGIYDSSRFGIQWDVPVIEQVPSCQESAVEDCRVDDADAVRVKPVY